VKKILIIEDDPYHARLMVKLLERAGYQVLHEAEGESGLKLALSEKPDLILLDMGLPDLDGQTAAGLIKGSTFLSETAVIAVTAWPKDTASKMAQAYGCDGYISKPIKARHFAAEVAKYLP